MNGKKLKVLNVGTEWFVPFLEEQKVEVLRLEWAPKVRNPDDVSAILRRLREG
jgi:hypothetical protein